jgi:hypothetical protein
MVWWWWIVPAVVGVFGLAIVLSGLGWMFRGRPFKGGRGVVSGGLLLGAGAAVSLLGLNVQTYHRLTAERVVATIEIKEKGPQWYDVTITEAPNEAGVQPVPRVLDVHGDEWRLEARVLKWKPWATVLGLDSQYRLDRLSGHYTETVDEQTRERSVYDLRPGRSTGIDFLPVAQVAAEYIPLVDIPKFGNGVYMPMADGARYKVTILASGGLLPRTDNDAAAEAVANWGN